MKKFLIFLTLFVVLLGLGASGHLFYLQTHREFGPKDFYHPFILKLKGTICPEEEVKKQAAEILNQPFSYLSYGGQMTVYQSQDGKYVIKFFNPRSVIKKNWFYRWDKMRRLNSFRWITNTYFRKEARLKKYFLRYEMAFKDLRNETGLVYVHLDPSTALSHSLDVVDKEGRLHRIALEAYPFVLQKKVELTMDHFGRLLKTGDLFGAQKSVEQIYNLFVLRAQKGYTDRLQTLHKNYGFFEGRAVQLDVGRIRKDSKINLVQEMRRIVSNISPSLIEADPNFAQVLEQCLQRDFSLE